jgi:hypothetical protein
MNDHSKIDPAVAAFAEVAQRFRNWAESAPGEPHDEMLLARELLAELHLAILQVPDLGVGESTKDAFSAKEWTRVCSRFQQLPVSGYWDVFNPLVEEAPVFNSLWDDLSDIYRDLIEGLHLYDDGKVVEAVWEWRFGFESHWGAHLTGAQRAIYAYFS